MKRLHFRPSRLLLLIVLSIFLLALVIAVINHFFSWQYGLLLQDWLYALSLVVIGAVVCDYWISRYPTEINFFRHVPGSVAVNKWTPMTLVLRHKTLYRMDIELCDLYSVRLELANPRMRLRALPGEKITINTQFRALARGDLVLPGCHVRLSSQFKLWQFAFTVGEPVTVKVYPDFEAIAGYSLLAMTNHISRLGIRIRPKRGEGLNFLQLREYRSGDTMRQIDWKATSRRQELVSKEYHDERDQNIILLIDSGQQMRAKDGTLSHFDHALNASLLLSYIALRQGDSVSVMSFGNMARWIPAHKGAASISSILNSVYDLHSGLAVSDYVEAARNLIARQRKRSLVVLITNVREEHMEELAAAIKLLHKYHLVLLANVYDQSIAEAERRPVKNLDDALRYSAVSHYLQQRRKMDKKLRAQRIVLLDCEPQQLAIQMANRYWGIKRAGVL